MAEQARRTALMCRAYPGMTPSLVIDELDARFRCARDQHQAAGRTEAVSIFDGMIAWLSRHRRDITTMPGASP